MMYESYGTFVAGYDFDKMLNKLKKNDENYSWICNYSTKAVKAALQDEEKAFKRFFKKQGGYPKFKSRKRLTKESFYFIKEGIRRTDNKYIIRIPILGKIRITEYDYIPDISSITSGRVIKDHDKYYVSFTYNEKPVENFRHSKLKLGIDVGIKYYATIYMSDNSYIQKDSFLQDPKYKKIHDKIQRIQEIISKKAEINYWKLLNQYLDSHDGNEPDETTKRIKRGESYNTSNIRRLKRKICSLHNKLVNIRTDFINKLVYDIVARTKPRIITVENLDISEMIENIKNQTNDHNLHRMIAESSFYTFKTCLANKCKTYGCKLRFADKFFASSKICSRCGNKLETLKLTDRTYHCESCGFTIDRDVNAAINLCSLKKKNYTVCI